MNPETKQFSEWLINRDYEAIKTWAASTNGTTAMCIIVEAMIHVDGIVDDRDFGDLAFEMGVL